MAAPEITARSSGSAPEVDFDHRAELCVAENPLPLVHQLQQQCPVAHTSAYGGSWVLTRYQDIYQAARDTETFSSAQGMAIPHHGMAFLPPIEVDPPLHTEYRGPLVSMFSPRAVARHEPAIRQTVTELIDAFIDDGRADLCDQLVVPLPAIVNTPIIGVTTDRRAEFQDWAVRILSSGGEDMAAIGSMLGYFNELYGIRSADPRDDLPSLLISMKINGESMTQGDFILTMTMLLTAGLDTTTNSAAHMLIYLAEHPDRRRELIEHPDRIPAAVEELLRFVAPVPMVSRTTTRDVELHGCTIPKGERVQLLWMFANHDPDEFPEPDQVRFDRPANRHFGFGVGAHRCLGSNLARLELTVVLQETLRRLGEYDIVAPGPQRYAGVTRGVSSLPVTFRPGGRISSSPAG